MSILHASLYFIFGNLVLPYSLFPLPFALHSSGHSPLFPLHFLFHFSTRTDPFSIFSTMMDRLWQ
jgi:hypothetical protein